MGVCAFVGGGFYRKMMFLFLFAVGVRGGCQWPARGSNLARSKREKEYAMKYYA